MRKIYYFKSFNNDGGNSYISIKKIGDGNLVEINDKLGYRTYKNITKEHFNKLYNGIKEINGGIYDIVTL